MFDPLQYDGIYELVRQPAACRILDSSPAAAARDERFAVVDGPTISLGDAFRLQHFLRTGDRQPDVDNSPRTTAGATGSDAPADSPQVSQLDPARSIPSTPMSRGGSVLQTASTSGSVSLNGLAATETRASLGSSLTMQPEPDVREALATPSVPPPAEVIVVISDDEIDDEIDAAPRQIYPTVRYWTEGCLQL